MPSFDKLSMGSCCIQNENTIGNPIIAKPVTLILTPHIDFDWKILIFGNQTRKSAVMLNKIKPEKMSFIPISLSVVAATIKPIIASNSDGENIKFILFIYYH